MVEVKIAILNNEAMFRRGSELEEMKILREMQNNSVKSVWMVNDFKIEKRKARFILEKLTKKGYIEKIEGYPNFWRIL